MRTVKVRAMVAVAAVLALAVTAAAPDVRSAGVEPHPLCKTDASGALRDACLVYDTGRATGRKGIRAGEGPVDVAEALALPADLDVLVLGESHDNPHHHRLRAGLLKANAIVLEQVSADRQPGLGTFNAMVREALRLPTVGDFKAMVAWEKSGWKAYPYDPLLDAIVAARVPVYAGDPPRDLLRKVAKDGFETLPESERARLKLDTPLDAELDRALAEEIEAAHCATLPPAAIPRMVLAQRFRDAHLADATMGAAEAHGSAVLLTGNGHARTDRGVPWYIRARSEAMTVISVALIEVQAEQTAPEAYVPRDPEGHPAADFIVLTPRPEREDPCKAFAK